VKRLGKYKIYFTNGDVVETPYCKLSASVDNQFLIQKDPSDYVKDVQRTYVLANINYWEPIE